MFKHKDHTHNTVSEARACEQGTVITKPSPTAKPSAAQSVVLDRLRRQHANLGPAKATAEFATSPAHPNRVAFATKLLGERAVKHLDMSASEVMMAVMDGKPVSKREIGYLIDGLLKCPKADTATPTAPAAGHAEPAKGPSLRDLCEPLADKGYYALLTPGTEDEIHYYRITRGKKGYMKVQEQASDTLYPVDYRRSLAVVKAILEGVEAAQHLYADTLEKCYRCGRTLTDETSRALRIGPDCRSK